MTLIKIYQQLGIEPEYKKEIEKLNSRIILIVDEFYKILKHNEQLYETLLKEFAFSIGEHNIDELVPFRNGVARFVPSCRPLKVFFKGPNDNNAFQTNILHLTYLLEVSKVVLSKADLEVAYTFLLNKVKKVMESAPIEIGFIFFDNTIIKKGAEELDKKLILENLTWLSNYPNIRQGFGTALKFYLTKDYPDSITNAYSALESLVKTFLNTKKKLDDTETRADLIKNLGLENDWGQLLFHYCKLANEFSSRHGKKEPGKKIALAIELIEFYIYFTGTFIRLISQNMKKRKIVLVPKKTGKKK